MAILEGLRTTTYRFKEQIRDRKEAWVVNHYRDPENPEKPRNENSKLPKVVFSGTFGRLEDRRWRPGESHPKEKRALESSAETVILFDRKFLENKPLIEDYRIVDASGNPTWELLDLLEGVRVRGHRGTLEGVDTVMQERFYPKDKYGRPIERWNLRKVENRYRKYRKKIESSLDRVGMRKDIAPVNNDYDQVLLLGAAFNGFFNRVDGFKRLRDKGIRVNKVVLMGGERELTKPKPEEKRRWWKRRRKSSKSEIEQPKDRYGDDALGLRTELDMMRFVWNKEVFHDSGIVVEEVNAPMKPNPKNEDKPFRPTTDDVYRLWRESNPTGSCLVISNSLYALRQHFVAKKNLSGCDVEVETVGEVVDPPNSTAVHLREVTSLVHEELNLQKSKKAKEIIVF